MEIEVHEPKLRGRQMEPSQASPSNTNGGTPKHREQKLPENGQEQVGNSPATETNRKSSCQRQMQTPYADRQKGRLK